MTKDFNIIDKDGQWQMNVSQYRFAHTRENGDVITLDSGMPTKVKADKYMKAQPTLVPCPDPLGDGEMPKVMVSTDNTLVPVDQNGDLDTAKAPGVLGTTAETSVTGNKPTASAKK